MRKRRYRKPVCIGDLVRHVLMDEGWLGILLEIKQADNSKTKKARVLMISEHEFPHGMRHEGKRDIGWVDVDWLEIKSRNQS